MKENSSTFPPHIKQLLDDQKGTLLITALDLSVLYVNKQTKTTTGFSPAEMISGKPNKLSGGEMDSAFYKKLWQIININKQPFVGQLHNTKKDGSTYWEQLHVAPVLDDAGAVKFFIELKPPTLATARERRTFARDFIDEFQHQKNNGDHIIKFLFHSLALVVPPEFSSKPTSAPKEITPDRLFSFINQILVKPTSAQYAERRSDHQLVLNAQKQTSAFDMLYQKYWKDIKSYFKKRIPDASLADDLAQETFIKAFNALPRFIISNASYLTYLLKIAHNVLATFYQKRRPTIALDGAASVENRAMKSVDFAKLWDLETMWRLVLALPPIEQRVLYLKYKEDKTTKEIAQYVSKTENAIKLILSRSRKKLHTAFSLTG